MTEAVKVFVWNSIAFTLQTEHHHGNFSLHLFIKKKLKKSYHKLDQAATSMFWEGRMTGDLGLFWYSSPRNAYRYSNASVWEGSFIDEVRLLTAMKQNLKQIKRHFPQHDSWFLQLAQVLHLKTERERERCGDEQSTLLHCFGRHRKRKKCSFVYFFVCVWHLLFNLPALFLYQFAAA